MLDILAESPWSSSSLLSAEVVVCCGGVLALGLRGLEGDACESDSGSGCLAAAGALGCFVFLGEVGGVELEVAGRRLRGEDAAVEDAEL